MYVITGATGHVGSRVADLMLKQKKQIRVIGRDASRLKHLSDRGAEPFAGDGDDASFLGKAFQGAEAVFVMIPPDLYASDLGAQQDRFGEAIFSALKQTSVPFVVNLSSVGGELAKGTGPIAGLHRQEQRLNRLDAAVLHLRPTYFMENFLANIPVIKHMGINGSPMKPDLRFPTIATRDVGDVAADVLVNHSFQDKSVRYLLGPRDVTPVEATRILGAAIGKPDLPYVQFSEEDAEKGMVDAGISPSVAKAFVEMNHAFNTGLVSFPLRNAENTTPTTLEEFAQQVFAKVYAS